MNYAQTAEGELVNLDRCTCISLFETYEGTAIWACDTTAPVETTDKSGARTMGYGQSWRISPYFQTEHDAKVRMRDLAVGINSGSLIKLF